MRPLGKSTSRKMSPPFPSQDPWNLQRQCPLTPSAPSSVPENIYTSRSRRSSFALTLANSRDQRSCGVGPCWTPSSYRYSLPRKLSWMEKHHQHRFSRFFPPQYWIPDWKLPPIHQRSRGKTSQESKTIQRTRQNMGRPQSAKIQTPSHIISTTSWPSSKPSRWRLPGWRTSAQGTGSGNGLLTIYPPSQPLPLPSPKTTQVSWESWVISQRDLKTCNPYGQLLWHRARPI